MKFQAVKGTRDFYPQEMRLRNWIMDAWRRVSLRNGFEEYDAPIFEYLDLFTAKSGPEIAEQLFSLTDRGGRNLAIRPEMTPALARMVNEKINSLPRPIKWFSMPRVCRAEAPQKGRLREFFQWNIDIIGEDNVIADAECIYVLVDLLRELGLKADEVKVRIGSRALTVAFLQGVGVGADAVDSVLPVLDKRPKVSPEEFARLAAAAGLSAEQVARIAQFQDCPDIGALKAAMAGRDEAGKAITDLEQLLTILRTMGVADYCRLDMRIVRGLAYYTGIVYEVFDAGESLRAVAGGGRYDNLLQVLGGPKVGATGFGMGDVVLGILLQEKGKLPANLGSGQLDYFVADDAPELFEQVVSLVAAIRARGRSADFSYKRQAVGKQLQTANRRGAKNAVIVKAGGQVALKDLSRGQQQEMSMEAFLKSV
jgi:histidyl-tRNA synthetase